MATGESLTKTFKIPISYLDYDYIEKCTNVAELEKIFLTLKTGEEGKYPDLEKFCEEKLTKLSPNSRALRKPSELISLNQLDAPIKEEIINDFQSWIDDMKSIDKSLNITKSTNNSINEDSSKFPIRQKQNQSMSDTNTKCNKSSTKSHKPKDYNEWSKIANELEKQMILEEKEETSKLESSETKKPKLKSQVVKGLPSTIDTTGMSKLEQEKIALREKEKGNEAFKSGDLSEAIIYYTRSLSVEPIAPVYNNRGLVYMKEKRWEEAIRDLSVTLKKDSSNIKALQRRATCYSEIHNLPDAINDCHKILKLNIDNKFAENLLAKSQGELLKRSQPKLKDGKRMVITEIISDDESSDEDQEAKEIEEKFVELPSTDKEENTKHDSKTDAKIKSSESSMPIDQDTSEQEFIKVKDYGNQLFKELKYLEALSVYDKLVEIWPSNPIGYRNRAACNLVLEHPQDVIRDCSIAIQLDKDSHLSYYRRGKAFKLLKRYGESFSDLEKALQLSPNHSQIKEELNEVEALLEEFNSKMSYSTDISTIDIIENPNDADINLENNSSENNSTEDTIYVTNVDYQESANQDPSGTWEFLGMSELTGSLEQQSYSESNSEILLKRSTTKPMTKHEFDKQLNNVRVKSDWKSTIQLLIDADSENISSLIGTKLDGFILEKVISSLLEYSRNKENVYFIKTILQELTKVERFCFIKMMISDHSLSELDRLFQYLKENYSNLAEIDCLQHKYQ